MTDSTPKRKIVGVIGLGKMGTPMTRSLIQAGFSVVVHNRSRAAVDKLQNEGAEATDGPDGIAQRAEVIVTSLPDPPAVEAVYLGENGLVANAQAGQVYVDTSTVDPDLSRRLAGELEAKGAAFLDAPVSGGVAGAEAGTLTIMVGGDGEAFERVRPVLEALGERIHHVGPSGSGTVIKLANQLLVGINVAGVAEAMVLGVKAGADPAAMFEVLSSSFGGSRMLDRGVPLILDRNFGGGTPVDLIRKDLGLITALARELGVPLSSGENAQAIFNTAHDADLGTEDMVAVVRPMEQRAGVEVHSSRGRTS
jgi:3-hydroxyisobutyrate dehydrogenase